MEDSDIAIVASDAEAILVGLATPTAVQRRALDLLGVTVPA